MSNRRNEFLDNGLSEESDLEGGYDSEAEELLKGARSSVFGRSSKKRKLSHSSGDNEEEYSQVKSKTDASNYVEFGGKYSVNPEVHNNEQGTPSIVKGQAAEASGPVEVTQKHTKSKKISSTKETKPGVIYMSSLPPYLKPSALRNLLAQRGFEPISRLFLTPASKAKSNSQKNSRQMYSEGWIEFASKKTARRCAEALNAQIIGGKKGGFYYDDIWNMKYLKGMGWSELMAGIREEKREAEGRRDEERRQIAIETKRFVEGVEEGKKIEGIKRKRSEKAKKGSGHERDTEGDVKRTWRQFEVKGTDSGSAKPRKNEKINDDVKEVLGKIF